MVKAAKTKQSRGASSGMRLRLKWAIFCKSIAQEPDTKEITLIGILPGMNVKIETPSGTEKGPFNLPIPLWVNAVFAIENPPQEPRKEQLEVDFNIGAKSATDRAGARSSEDTIEIEVKPRELSATLNMRVQLPNGLPVVPGFQLFSVTFRHNGKDLGNAELPITVVVDSRMR